MKYIKSKYTKNDAHEYKYKHYVFDASYSYVYKRIKKKCKTTRINKY